MGLTFTQTCVHSCSKKKQWCVNQRCVIALRKVHGGKSLFQNVMGSTGERRREKSREWIVGAEGIAAHGEWQWCKTRHLTKGDSVPWIGVREGRAVVRGVANTFIMRFLRFEITDIDLFLEKAHLGHVVIG